MIEERTDALPSAGSRLRQREATLLIVEGPDAGKRHKLQRGKTRLGKELSCDLCLLDASVSRAHCELELTDSGCVIRDLGSTNGTCVDGTRISEAWLRPGSRIQLGKVHLLFQPVHQASEVPPSKSTQYGELVGSSAAIRQVFTVLERVAPTDATLLLAGETGVGKGAVARAVHAQSACTGGPFVVVDCGSISSSLIEGELFGAEKGAYTGADGARAGAFEAADGGTLFLDEVDDLPLELQPKLLRVLEEREVRRLGSTRPRKLDIRVIAATKRDLEAMIAARTFREDLYFRLAVVRIELPPLRERLEDLPRLAERFIGEPGGWERLSEPLKEQLQQHAWPGNVRELRNVLDRLRYLGLQDAEGIPLGPVAAEAQTPGLEQVDFSQPFKVAKESLVESFEREYLQRLLERARGRIAVAAREARLDRKYFYDLLRKHGLYDPDR